MEFNTRRRRKRTGDQYSSTTTVEVSGCGRRDHYGGRGEVTSGIRIQDEGVIYGHHQGPDRKRTPSLPPIIPNSYEEFEASGDTSGYASDSAGNEYLSHHSRLPEAQQHRHQSRDRQSQTRHHQSANDGWIKQPLLPNQVAQPWTTSSSLSTYSCCGVPPTPDSLSICSWAGGDLPRAKWGDRGVGVGHLWTATPHLPDANLPLPPESSRLSGQPSNRQLNPPAWIHRNGVRDGGAEVLVISHTDDERSVRRHHQHHQADQHHHQADQHHHQADQHHHQADQHHHQADQHHHQADQHHQQTDAMSSRHSCDTLVSSPDDFQRTYIRGQNVHLEPDELADRERKRQKALEHQRAIRQQVEEKERKKREEQERQEREERAADERLKRQQELERRRIEEERRKQRQKEEKEERIAQAMREALELAERTAKEAKARARMRHLVVPTKKLRHQQAITREPTRESETNAVADILTERLLPVKALPVQVMIAMTSDARSATAAAGSSTSMRREESDYAPEEEKKKKPRRESGGGEGRRQETPDDAEERRALDVGAGSTGGGREGGSDGSDTPPPPSPPGSEDDVPKAEDNDEDKAKEEETPKAQEDDPKQEPPEPQVHPHFEENEEDSRPARVLNLRTKLIAKPHRRAKRRPAAKNDERRGDEGGEEKKDEDKGEEGSEDSEEDGLTVALENMTLVEGGQIEVNQLSIVPRLDTPNRERLLTPTKFRPKRNNYEKSTQTTADSQTSKNDEHRRGRGSMGGGRCPAEERPKWGVNRPDRRYVKASDRDPFIRRIRCLRYLRTRSGAKDSREDSRSPSPLNQSKSSYFESSNSSMNRSRGVLDNNGKRVVTQSSIGVSTPRIIQVLPPGGVTRKLSAGKRYLSIRGNIGVTNGTRMTNRPQMVPIEKQHHQQYQQQPGLQHQQITSVQEVLYQLTALKHGLQMKQQEWEVSRSQTPYSEISSK